MPTDDNGYDPDLEHDTQHDPALDEEPDWYDDEEGGEVDADPW